MIFSQGIARIVQPQYVPSAIQVLEQLSSELTASTQPNVVKPVTQAEQENGNTIKPTTINSVVKSDGSIRIILPEPQIAAAPQHFKSIRSNIRAIIAWNGKTDGDGEEIMIIESSYELSDTGKNEACIGIIPLSGKPISVERGDKNVWSQTKIFLDKKLEEKLPKPRGIAVTGMPLIHSITSYNVFVLEIQKIDRFVNDINYYVQKFYDSKIRVDFQMKDIEVIKKYWDQGFRYFAFDIAPLRTRPSDKLPLVFRFRSKFAYYPLAISTIGGTGHSLIDLVVMTPETIGLAGAFEPGKEEAEITVKGKTSVDFTITEVEELDPQLADVFRNSNLNSVKVRNFLFEAEDIGKTFTKDFIAIPHVSNKDVLKQSDTENESVVPADTVPVPDKDIQEQPDTVEHAPITQKNVQQTQQSDIHLLFVIGTPDEKVRPVINESKRRLVQLLETTGVSPDVKNFDVSLKRVKAESIMFLEGEKATPENILEQCRELDKQTGKDGVIFVYFLCRDAETENGQILYPLAKSSTELGVGISQKDIRDAISKHEHRLCVLITDGCQSDNVQRNHEEASSTSTDQIYMFSSLLLYGKGKYNIRSASPEKNEIPLGTPEIGCFFTNAFVNNMDTPIEDTGEFDMNERILKWVQSDLNIFCNDATFMKNKRPVRQTIKMW